MASDGWVLFHRGSWADKTGDVKGTYTDEITQPAEEINCRCGYVVVYALRGVPANMLTAKGKEMLMQARPSAGRLDGRSSRSCGAQWG